MISRLVLGCGSVGRTVLEALSDGRGELTVLEGDESRVTALREEGIQAQCTDPADPGVLSGYEADVVFVADDDRSVNRRAVVAARETFPDAHVVAYVPGETTDGVIAEHADAVVDPGAVLVERLLNVVGSESGLRTRRLRQVLRTVEGPLAVVMHDNPDPDAIGSALALARLAETVGVEAVPCYYGEINHQENRALVNLLDLELRNLADDEGIESFGGVALVDHSRPGVNDQLPQDTRVDVVIDHHPPRAPVEARFVDLRQKVGATSTLLVDYLVRLGVDLDEQVATALLYGIRVDTADFSREASTEDFEATARLLAHVDYDVLGRIENPSISGDTMETMARAIDNRDVRGTVLTTYVGPIGNRDTLAQAAEILLGMDEVTTVLVFGRHEEVVYLSARARGADIDLGETVRLAYGQIGSAGGHADMAGAQIPLRSILALPADGEEDVDDVVEDVVVERFLETIESRPASLTGRFDTGVDEGIVSSEPHGTLFGSRGDEE